MEPIFEGVVVRGRQLGRTMGFPTVNIEIRGEVEAEDGVYFSLVSHKNEQWFALSNLGKNPTVGGQKRLLESHLLNFSGEELYGEQISVQLLGFLRREVRFDSIEQLRSQIEQDLKAAYRYFEQHFAHRAR